jgi:hypothetical protein
LLWAEQGVQYAEVQLLSTAMRIIRLWSLPATIGTRIAVACSAAALAIGFATGAGIVCAFGADLAPAVAHTTAPVPAPSTATATSPGGQHRPEAHDFIMNAYITSKKCYGTVGCDYVYTPSPMYVGKQPFPLPSGYTVTYGVLLCERYCDLTSRGENPENYSQVSSFTISPDGLMTYDKQGTINGPDGLRVVLNVLVILEDHSVRPAR